MQVMTAMLPKSGLGSERMRFHLSAKLEVFARDCDSDILCSLNGIDCHLLGTKSSKDSGSGANAEGVPLDLLSIVVKVDNCKQRKRGRRGRAHANFTQNRLKPMMTIKMECTVT